MPTRAQVIMAWYGEQIARELRGHVKLLECTTGDIIVFGVDSGEEHGLETIDVELRGA